MASSPKRPAPPGPVDPASASSHSPSLKKPRRNPALSCQLCRIKKIKCSRVFPCSNCVTRNVDCVPQDGNALSERVWTPRSRGESVREPAAASPLALVATSGPATTTTMTPQFYRYPNEPSSSRTPSATTPGPEQQQQPKPRRSYESSFRVDGEDGMSAPSGICVLSMVASREAQIQDRELKTAGLLEELRYSERAPVPPPIELVSRSDPPPPPPPSKLPPSSRDAISPFEVNGAPPHPVASPPGIMDNPSAPRTIAPARHRYHENSLSRVSIFEPLKHQSIDRMLARLPPENEAMMLLANYFDLIHPIHPILHESTVYNQFKEVYAYASSYSSLGTEALAGTLAIVCTVLAIGAYYWQPGKMGALDWSSQTTMHMSKKLETAAIDALSVANFMSCPTLETMQACVLLPLIQHSSDADSFRNMSGAVIRMAQSRGYHRLGQQPLPDENRILIECQRRLWWYIASADWLDASHGGPLHGTYAIHPSQIRCTYPTHCDDHNLTPSSAFSKDLSIPTCTTYFHYRLQLSHIARDFIDLLPSLSLSSPPPSTSQYSSSHSPPSQYHPHRPNPQHPPRHTEDYDSLLTLDSHLRNLLKSLPRFLRLDHHSLSTTTDLTHHRPYLTAQRILLNLGLHSLLLRLHAPFLARGTDEPRYAYSKMTATRSAHIILSLYRRILSPPSPTTNGTTSNTSNTDAATTQLLTAFLPQQIKQWIGIGTLLHAAVVLAVDTACNDEEPYSEETRNAVVEACGLVDGRGSDGDAALVRRVLEVVVRWKEVVGRWKEEGRGGSEGGAAGKGAEEESDGATTPPQQQQGDYAQIQGEYGRRGSAPVGKLERSGREDWQQGRLAQELVEWGVAGGAEWWEWAGLVKDVEAVVGREKGVWML
ncbi:hypothetical protein EX30DRAFT_374869 [Ascodesmis nigricans]|uniref:Zn(2)-C6 fungal-type domain-containing protein n=1 Tax=Ascodesmis nigricans TaxID=341454 RepID=A0A4S2MPC7_9PEZI|nr:hypothetical protein EX30DRAFT_374869 [Ascodesmis nigricans]